MSAQDLSPLGTSAARDAVLKQMRILIVDDRASNVTMIERVLAGAGYRQISTSTDPTEVEEIWRRLTPDLLLLDLHMQPFDGFEIMSRLAPAIADRTLTVLVLTADVSIYARRHALSLGARDFLTKPLDAAEVVLRVHHLLETRYLEQRLATENERLGKAVAERTEQLERARRELLDRLALMAEYRDYTTAEHTLRVGRTAALLGERLGLQPEDVEMLRDAAPLHDIGKLGVSDSILLKPGPLNTKERDLMRRHVEIGAEMLSMSQSPVLRIAQAIARSHHERWDGGGYSAGVAGERIPLVARITAVADVFDALTHQRPYKPAYSVHDAEQEIYGQAGQQFDPDIVAAFAELDHLALI